MPRKRITPVEQTAQTEEQALDAAGQIAPPVQEPEVPAQESEVPVQEAAIPAEQETGTPTAPVEEAAPTEQALTEEDVPTEQTPTEQTPTEQTATEAPAAPVQEEPAEQAVTMRVRIHAGDPAEDILATADVQVGGVGTIRNVKIKADDYGTTVVMPRTRMVESGRFKDAFYFESRELRQQFNAAVLDAYQQTMTLCQRDAPEQAEGMAQEYGAMTM